MEHRAEGVTAGLILLLPRLPTTCYLLLTTYCLRPPHYHMMPIRSTRQTEDLLRQEQKAPFRRTEAGAIGPRVARWRLRQANSERAT